MQEAETKKTILPGDYISGFVDGEGCFYLNFRKETKLNRPGAPSYYRWIAYFAIMLDKSDVQILNSIQDTIGCGKVYTNQKNQVSLNVQNLDDCYKLLIPFFHLHKLRAKKKIDFELWSEAVTILFRLKKGELKRDTLIDKQLEEIQNNMRRIKGNLKRGYKNNLKN